MKTGKRLAECQKLVDKNKLYDIIRTNFKLYWKENANANNK